MTSLFESKLKEGPKQVALHIEKTTLTLLETWKIIGVDEVTQLKKLDRIFGTLVDMCTALESRETKTIVEYQENIKKNRQKIKNLCNQLNIEYDTIKCDTYKTLIEEDTLMQSYLEIMETKKKKRLDEFEKLALRQEILCDQLGISCLDIKSDVPSVDEIKMLDQRVNELEFIKAERKTKLTNYLHDITSLAAEFEFNLCEIPNIINLKLTENDLNRVKMQYDEFKTLETTTRNEIQKYKTKINELCSILEVSDDEKDKILCKETVFKSQKYLNLLKQEHNRLIQIKQEYNHKLIIKLRQEIVELNEKLFQTLEIDDEFTDFFNETNINEELLAKHQEKLKDLRLLYQEFKCLFDKLDTWNDLWRTFVIFDKKSSDPSRFRAKGYNALQEEKQRKEFRVRFSRLEDELMTLALKYKSCNNRDFKIKEQSIREYVTKIKRDYESQRKSQAKPQMTRANSMKNENLKRLSTTRVSLMIVPKTPTRKSTTFTHTTIAITTPKSATRITADKLAKRSRESFYKKSQVPKTPQHSESTA